MTPLTDNQRDALQEIINIGVGRGASVLNTMLNSHIVLKVPFVDIVSSAKLKNELEGMGGKKFASINMAFKGEFSGNTQLVFPTQSASKLVDVLVGDESGLSDMDMDAIRAGTLCEIGNVVLNGIMGTIANIFEISFSYTVPDFFEESIDNLISLNEKNEDRAILLARTSFIVQSLNIDGDIIIFFEVASLNALLSHIDKM